MKIKKFDISKIEDLKSVCNKLSKQFSQKQIVLLNGPMAAGKTKAVEFFLEALGSKSSSSPTFAIHQSYSTPNRQVDHIDLYRLKNDYDLETTGFWDLFSRKSGLIFIEWADRLHGDWIPKGWNVMTLDFVVSDSKRELHVKQL